MKRTVIALSLVLIASSAQAQECRGLLSRIFGTKPLFTCEERRMMMETGTAMMRAAPPPPAPVFIQPAPMQFHPAPLPPQSTVIVPMNGGAPTIFVPIQ